jgi:hypothetical protein
MKKSKQVLLVLSAIAALSAPPAQALTVVNGRIVATYADPDDFVIELNAPGICGSKFFHVKRAAKNFREMTAVALVAVAGAKNMTMFVESCAGDRNILSHGAVFP